MSDQKKYYYLKLKDNFFSSEEMKILASQKNGSEYQLLYTKLMLLSVKSEGRLEFRHGVPYDAGMLSSILDVHIDTVKSGIELFEKLHLVEMLETGVIFMADIQNMIGKSSTEAERKLDYRRKIEIEHSKKNHIPYIESYINKKRYGGNYYIAFERDGKKCVVCGDTNNLKMHHICGYNAEKPENNDISKLVTLCQKCHGEAHKNDNSDIMKIISGHLSGQLLIMSNSCPPEIELDKDKEIELDIKPKKATSFIPPTIDEVKTYLSEKRITCIDPESFLAYYEARGWMLGKNKVKDWTCCVTTWVKNSNKFKPEHKKAGHVDKEFSTDF